MAALPAISMNRRAALSAAAVGLTMAAVPMPNVNAAPAVIAMPEGAGADMWAMLARWQALQVLMVRAPASEAEEAEYDPRFKEADGLLLSMFTLPPRTAGDWAVKAYLLLHAQFGQGRNDALRPCLDFLSEGIEDKLFVLLMADVERMFDGMPVAA